ncbi:MAG: DUF3611 family protein [Cyanobacteria bacterium J06634_6]
MTGELGYSLPPAIRRISKNFRIAGWASFWCQIVIGVISTLLFLINALAQENNLSNPGSDFFQAAGIVIVFISAAWGFRYVQVGRKLRSTDPDLRPKPRDAGRAVRLGTIISMVGMLLTLFAAQAIVALVWLQALSQVNNNNINFKPINAVEIAVIFSAVNTMFAHFIGLCASLWLNYVVDRS